MFNPVYEDINSKRVGVVHSKVSKQRLRSLPIINYKKVPSHAHLKLIIPLLPPINLSLLKEIDLNEILKNPQLRHDILFDPQLQFRPNLDGERGKRKKTIIDKYWLEVFKECRQFWDAPGPAGASTGPTHSTSGASGPTGPPGPPGHSNGGTVGVKLIRIPLLFQTLRDILLLLLPLKDHAMIYEVLDLELINQQLKFRNFDFLKLAEFLKNFFKNHCAPMRDLLVNKMYESFRMSFDNLHYLIGGLKLIFQILECMKLDIANHQIRLLRPILIETAIDFEKDYFNQLISHHKISIGDSVSWYQANYAQNRPKLVFSAEINHKLNLVLLIFSLLSCKKMVNEFPQTLSFDHTRLILLRADIRQIIVLKLCINLFTSLVVDNKLSPRLLQKVEPLKQEILSIVTDNNGNIKWTKNIALISLQLVKNLEVQGDKFDSLTQLCNAWLAKQVQPVLPIYKLMENSYFNSLFDELQHNLVSGREVENNIGGRLLILVNFNWSVFGGYYGAGGEGEGEGERRAES